MSLNKLIVTAPLKLRFQNISARYYCSKSDKILESAQEEPLFIEEEKDTSELQEKRNKSKLSVGHRNILFDQNPYDEPKAWYHNTVKYKKRILGRYGMEAVGVPVGFAWPLPKEVEEQKEYESIAYPPNIQERLQKIKEKKKKNEEMLIARQEQIDKKMATMKQLIAEVQEKIARKEAKELEAKMLKKEKIEKIRQQLIAEGNASDEKLKEALTLIEKKEKKKKKELKSTKMLERQQKLLQKMAQEQENENPEKTDKNEDEK